MGHPLITPSELQQGKETVAGIKIMEALDCFDSRHFHFKQTGEKFLLNITDYRHFPTHTDFKFADNKKQVVYVYANSENEIIYVGRTFDSGGRQREHEKDLVKTGQASHLFTINFDEEFFYIAYALEMFLLHRWRKSEPLKNGNFH